ncbi:DinB family protein [Bacillus sp. FJAT-26390]|uniref:DinB family protein n=1 Tax=Bacillus sp. FJAT-26390 TaxID=1743142 RepID=UPI000807C8BF|nr:DinB family protein [Bacillus sp. FJAT-26390]OBZ15777.1 hypothetical protein A7975_30480 [Bacillus sp. FJAT-26390]
MRTDFVFHNLNNQYGQLLELAAKCPVDGRHTVPEGFNNHIHWHLGHVLVSTELHILYLSDNAQEMTFPPEYLKLFGYGTKPSDWQTDPPVWELLVAQLKEQLGQLEAWLKDKLDTPVKDNFFKAETLGELVISTTVHASWHVGNVSAILKALK